MTTKELFIDQWQNECKCTLNAINSLPEDSSKWDYKPHPKARSAKQIIDHILPHAGSLVAACDAMVIREVPGSFTSKEEMSDYFKQQTELLLAKLAQVDDNTWETGNVDFIINPAVTFTLPMYKMFWTFMNDIIHHRGQLSTFYRAMGARNPNIYGPSAEDIEDMMAAANAANQN